MTITPLTLSAESVLLENAIGVLDIGSNTIRMVIYERHARWLTPIHNDKASAALGRGVAATGRIGELGFERALLAIKRFDLMAKRMNVSVIHILATSAVREAENGVAFTHAVQEIMGAPVRVLSGEEEAHFAARGVVAGIPDFNGVVGDLGGGSLEFCHVSEGQDSVGETHALGAIRLQDDSKKDVTLAETIARERLVHSKVLDESDGGTFCAIGGTWRAIARLHQVRTGYPLHMVHNYAVPASEIIDLCDGVVSAGLSKKALTELRSVSAARRELLPFGAAVLGEVLKAGKFEDIVFSSLGVREGYLFDLLPPQDQTEDPLLQASWEMCHLRARTPAQVDELIDFTQHTMFALRGQESVSQQRLRIAACHLSDIGWRGHPDYRGEQSVDLVAYSSFIGVDHPGRSFLAETLAVRYMGLKHKSVSLSILELAGPQSSIEARRLGAVMRVAYAISAGTPEILRGVSITMNEDSLTLKLPDEIQFLAGERVQSRLNQLANLMDKANTSIMINQWIPA